MKDRTSKPSVPTRVCRLEALEKRYALSADGFEFGSTQASSEFDRIQIESDRDAAIRSLKTQYPTLERELARLESNRLRSDRERSSHRDGANSRDLQDSISRSREDQSLGHDRDRHRSSHNSTLRPSGSAEGEFIEATSPSPDTNSRSPTSERPAEPRTSDPRTADPRPTITLITNTNSPFGGVGSGGNIPPSPPVNAGIEPPVVAGTPAATVVRTPPSVVVSNPSDSSAANSDTASDSNNSLAPIVVDGPDPLDLERTDQLTSSSPIPVTSSSGDELTLISSRTLQRSEVLSEFLEEQREKERLQNSTFLIPTLQSNQRSTVVQAQQQLTQDLSELDELLDALAIAHRKASQDGVGYTTSTDQAMEGVSESIRSIEPTSSAGMILLSTIQNPAETVATDGNQDLSPSNVAQWSVGIGFYRALELTGNVELHQPSGSESAAGEEAVMESVPPAADTLRQPSLSAHRGLSAVACVLGIQYLRRRKRGSEEEVLPIRRRWRIR